MTSPPRAIARAYRETAALIADCPNCGADIGVYCTRESEHGSHVRRIPCLARMTRRLDVDIADDVSAIDFSEPRTTEQREEHQ